MSYAESVGVRFCSQKKRAEIDVEDGLFVLKPEIDTLAHVLYRAATGADSGGDDTAIWACALLKALTDIVSDRAGVSLDHRAHAAVRAADGFVGRARAHRIREFLKNRPPVVIALSPSDMAGLSPGRAPPLPGRLSRKAVQIVTSVGAVAAYPNE
ncbi:MAG: hypothetical protein ACYDCF_08075 [Burkholderiales bacterium]